VIVDNLPTVTPEKYAKLYGILEKIFKNVGPIREGGIYMPRDPNTNLSLGFAFIEFVEPRYAAQAVQKLNGGKLDKSHIFAVNFYDDLKRFRDFPEEYVAPQPKEFEDKNNLYSWLLDDKHATGDQFVIRFDTETELYWHEADTKPELSYKKKNWTDSYVAWSSRGTYLATFHGKGVMLWGGETWNTLGKLEHPGVKLVDFSPREGFLTSFNPENSRDENALIVWNVKTGERIRSFPGGDAPWPIMKWSHDDKYVARLGKGAIHIWELPSMTLLNGKPLKIANVKDFQWSPTQHLICCWVPEDAATSTPARLMLIDPLTGKEKRTKNLFNVTDCKMHWQNKGEYLCVKVDRHQKKKKSTYFELFRLREKGVPIEVLELSNQTINAFAWEPEGKRFAIIHTGEAATRPDVSFYEMAANQFKHLKTFEKRPANHLFWSPRGNHVVLAGLRNFNGALEFVDVNEMETMATTDHFMATELEWDPTGRFVASASSAWRHQLENGYCIWSFQGRLLHKVLKEKFYQFLWRPRPPSLLSEEKEKEIRKNLPQIEKNYTEQDKKQKQKQDREKKRERDTLRRAFLDFLEQRKRQLRDEKEARRALRGHYSDDDRDYEYVTREIEEVVETHEEPLVD
jgi:translation initiation factor 3 subunit B